MGKNIVKRQASEQRRIDQAVSARTKELRCQLDAALSDKAAYQEEKAAILADAIRAAVAEERAACMREFIVKSFALVTLEQAHAWCEEMRQMCYDEQHKCGRDMGGVLLPVGLRAALDALNEKHK